MKKLRPLSDRILVERLEIEPTTASGIILPDEEKATSLRHGLVLTLGTGLRFGTKRIPFEVSEGDTVLFSKHNGIVMDDPRYLILREAEIMAIVEK